MVYSGAFAIPLSGLNAQQAALSAISNNIANSQTIGYRGVDTNFKALVAAATSSTYVGGGVASNPTYLNSVNGSISGTSISSNAAINGDGFFVVAQNNGGTFDGTNYYTRAGDFALNKDDYLVNGSGFYAQGYALDPTTGNVAGGLSPIQIAGTVTPTASSSVTYGANLPADAATGATFTSTADVYDSLGSSHTVTLNWTKGAAANTWTLTASSPDSTPATMMGSQTVTFDSSGNLTSAQSLTMNGAFPGAAASAIKLNFGATGLTQTSGTEVTVRDITTDGYAAGNLSSVSVGDDGTVTASYDNGEFVSGYKLGLAKFAAPDSLQSVSGGAFTATQTAGTPIYNVSSSSAAFGSIVGSAVEASNIDIGDQFTKMIVVQNAYSANTKVLTTVDQMLQEILNAKQ